MNPVHDEILTLDELAVYLKIPKSTLYKQVQEGKIPGQKIGKQWRFGKRAIDHWMNDVAGQSTTQNKEVEE